jgi:hypothetical protein
VHAAGALVLAFVAVAACGPGISPKPTPAVIASMPDTIPCEHPVKTSGDDRGAVRAEYRWLDALYPHHGQVSQLLHVAGRQRFDILTFTRADGRAALVCFDITDSYGRS